MKIDYFKDMTFWNNLKKYNNYLLEIGKRYKYTMTYNLHNLEASDYYNPALLFYKAVASAKSYPEIDRKIESDERYGLVLYNAYYMMLFLINKLYDDKSVLIEDVGGGDGKFFYYLDKLGFNNFNIVEEFSNLPQNLLYRNMRGIAFDLNNMYTQPKVVVNVGQYGKFSELAIRWTRSMELAMCYAHNGFDSDEFINRIERWGFKYLCRDLNDLSLAFCVEDKYNEFKDKLKDCVV